MNTSDVQGDPYKCLFCLSKGNSFLSVEHIFPESLGNKEKMLPKGVVCDKCNNETLSVLDSHLLKFEPISFLLTMNGVRSKKGKIPATGLGNMKIENPTGSHIQVTLDSLKSHKPTENGFKLLTKGGRKMTPRYLKLITRALYKIALELIYLDHGYDFAYSKRFDEIRRIVLGAEDFEGYLLIGSVNQRDHESGLTYSFLQDDETKKEFTCFEFNYMFLKIMSDLERRKSLLESNDKLLGMTVLKFEKETGNSI